MCWEKVTTQKGTMMQRHSILFCCSTAYVLIWNVVLRSFSFRTKDVQNHGVEKKRSRVEFLKLLQKDYSFSNWQYHGFQNYKDCYIQTPYSFQNQSISENHGIFLKQQKYFESKQGLSH